MSFDKLDNTVKPSFETISAYVHNPLWDALCQYIEKQYQPTQVIEYSRCSEPGWNVKYRKAGRSLCTLYPDNGCFICLIVIGEKEKNEAELLRPSFTPYMQKLYKETKTGMGQKWLMIHVSSRQVLEDVKKCLSIRRKPKAGNIGSTSIEPPISK